MGRARRREKGSRHSVNGIVKKLGRKVQTYQLDQISRQGRFDPRESIIVSANPRGGSTWLFEVLTSIQNTATLYEPLHQRWMPELAEIGFDWHQRIPADADWPEARQLFDDILSGRKLTPDVCQYSDIKDYRTAERLVVKFIRTNDCLPWLLNQFDFKLKPVVLTRHPIAIAASTLRHENWQGRPSHYVFPETRYSDYSDKDRAFLEGLSTVEEVRVAKWCTRNRSFLNHPGHNKDWITLHYEDMLLDPEKSLRHLFEAWQMELPEAAMSLVDKASRTSRETTFSDDKQQQLEKWQTRFTPDQIDRMIAILDHFEIDLYGRDAMPNMRSRMAAPITVSRR